MADNMGTIDEFDALTDDGFVDFVLQGRRPLFTVDDGQRAAMIEAHENWVAQMDEEERDMADWDTQTHSDWDLYAELRMNGVDFDRVAELTLAR